MFNHIAGTDMKIITLNIWGGRAGEHLVLGFLQRMASDTDVFCLQEIWSVDDTDTMIRLADGLQVIHKDIMFDGLKKISNTMPDFNLYFRPHYKDDYGLLTLVKKDIKVLEEGDVFVYRDKDFIPKENFGHHARNIQYVKIEKDGKELLVANFHGLWKEGGKNDSEERMLQSHKIASFFKKTKNRNVVLCGDFNLLPHTESLAIIEQVGFTNLITLNNISSTRSHFYDKQEKHADYIFVSDNLKVKRFEVIEEVVSDHLALMVEV